MDEHALQTLAYRSIPTNDFSGNSDILSLVINAQRFNAEVAVTGLLIFDSKGFLQTIEGPAEAVTQVFARIQSNSLHRDVHVFVNEPIAERLYPDWSMLNTAEHASDTLKFILQYALETRASTLTAGQIEAARLSVERLSE